MPKHLAVEAGGQGLVDDVRYFFYITNDWDKPAEDVVFSCNDRCDQENLLAQLAGGVRSLSAPVDNLYSNWAYMVMTSLAWTMKSWAALLLPALFVCFTPLAFGSNAEGIQIEFPENGQLRIENSFGSVAAESWQQKYILVSTSEGAVVSRRTSVVIENKNQVFLIRVVRRPGAPDGPIDLTIKVPVTSRLEVATGGGRVTLRGVPSSATVKSRPSCTTA